MWYHEIGHKQPTWKLSLSFHPLDNRNECNEDHNSKWNLEKLVLKNGHKIYTCYNEIGLVAPSIYTNIVLDAIGRAYH